MGFRLGSGATGHPGYSVVTDWGQGKNGSREAGW